MISRRYLLAGCAIALAGFASTTWVAYRDPSHLVCAALVLFWAAIALGCLAWAAGLARRSASDPRGYERRFLQAQKMEAIGRFAGGIAHDVNNYLGAIRAQCEVLQLTSRPDEEASTRMDAIVDSTERVSGLVQRLLAFARREPTHPETVQVNAVIHDLSKLFEGVTRDSVWTATELDPTLWPIEIDVSQLEQVLVNLVVNATEAMPRGGELEIRTGNRSVTAADSGPEAGGPSPGDYAVIEIRDSGSGIDPTVLDQIFEPFFTTKDPATSSGLGLATVYAIVQEAGGHITVESEPGEGSTFRVFLPRSGAVPELPKPRRSDADHPRAAGETILLVEDNRDLLETTSTLLRALGYRVLPAEDAARALQEAAHAAPPIDIVVTDVVLPGRNGRDLVDELRKTTPALPAVFVSGYTDDVVLRHGIAEGSVHFLRKPYSSRRLAAMVRTVLDEAGEGRPTDSQE